jgi:predicted ester cyclase
MEEMVLNQWFDAYNSRDWSAMEGLYNEDALIHGKSGKLQGGKALVEIAKLWTTAIPDACITPLYSCTEDDNLIVVHWRVEGTFTAPLKDFEPTGEKVVFHGHTCFRFENDQVIEHWASVDYRPLLSPEESLQR